MDINLLKKLIKVVESSNITEFSVQEGDLKVRISKNSKSAQMFAPGMNYQMPVGQHTSQVNAAEPASAPADAKKTPDADENLHEIKSPIVGTFYRAPAPDADPYIQVGDNISEGSVLCIVEAMKLMNEIESDISGKIVKILVEDATPVEYNQPLFLIQLD
jgi:acetyl-CoA carboxylase biotin carboxyl carrier protein